MPANVNSEALTNFGVELPVSGTLCVSVESRPSGLSLTVLSLTAFSSTCQQRTCDTSSLVTASVSVGSSSSVSWDALSTAPSVGSTNCGQLSGDVGVSGSSVGDDRGTSDSHALPISRGKGVSGPSLGEMQSCSLSESAVVAFEGVKPPKIFRCNLGTSSDSVHSSDLNFGTSGDERSDSQSNFSDVLCESAPLDLVA